MFLITFFTVLQSPQIPKIPTTYTGALIVSSGVMCVDISSPMLLNFSVGTLHNFGPHMVTCFTISCTVILSIIHTGVSITMFYYFFISSPSFQLSIILPNNILATICQNIYRHLQSSNIYFCLIIYYCLLLISS